MTLKTTKPTLIHVWITGILRVPKWYQIRALDNRMCYLENYQAHATPYMNYRYPPSPTINLFGSTAGWGCFRVTVQVHLKTPKSPWTPLRQWYHLCVLIFPLAPNFTPFHYTISHFQYISNIFFLLAQNAIFQSFFSHFLNFKFKNSKSILLCGLSHGTPIKIWLTKNHIKYRRSSTLNIVFSKKNRRGTEWPRKWTWTLQGLRYPIYMYVSFVPQSPKLHSVSLYWWSFSR